MATKRKKPKAGKRSIKLSKTAKKKRPAKHKPAVRKTMPKDFQIHVLYDGANVSVLEPDVTVPKSETLIEWVSAPGSSPFTFTLNPKLKSLFGTPTLGSNDTRIELRYHGYDKDKDRDFEYNLTVVKGQSVVEMSNTLVHNGSTIKNH